MADKGLLYSGLVGFVRGRWGRPCHVLCGGWLGGGKTAAEADALVDLVGSMFEIRKLGEPQDFLGIPICQDRSASTITVDQEDKAEALAAEVGVSGECRMVLMTPEVYGELRGAQPGEPMTDKLRYPRVVGSLLHLAQCTRPDIALSVAALAACLSEPSAQHFAVLLDVERYVGETASRGITYGGKGHPLGFWCDANFAACRDTRRSTTGWVVTMYGEAVSWSSKKQATAAASTLDAEYHGVWGCCTRGDVFAESTWGDGLVFVGLLVGWAGDN
jgi:hypothetical protein